MTHRPEFDVPLSSDVTGSLYGSVSCALQHGGWVAPCGCTDNDATFYYEHACDAGGTPMGTATR